MYCRHLSLANFRNYQRLELSLSPHLNVFWGENGQGKSNLLEAIYLLATTRSFRTGAERELVNWYATSSPVFARAAAEVIRHPAPAKLEIILAEAEAPPGPRAANPDASLGAHAGAGTGVLPGPEAQPDRRGANGGAPSGAAGLSPAESIRRHVRINGQSRPVVELLGHLNVVLFSPSDLDLIGGPAEGRRRYLHITLCQVDHRYLRTLRRYQRVLLQRNALLRELRERAAPPDQLEYWDEQVVALGAELTAAHLRAIALLNQYLAGIYPQLTDEPGPLHAVYRSSIELDADTESLAQRAGPDGEQALAAIRERFARRLAALRPREQQQGVTLAGPHRDDFGFQLGPVDLRIYGSRGQQRTAALCLKLAEMALMAHFTGERPVLLLDDVMSELDPRRQQFLQSALSGEDQVLLTATDLRSFSDAFLRRADLYRVAAGTVARCAP
jgi:DNA replication and repair protein RecF